MLADNQTLTVILALGVFSLLVTIVVFKFLESSAEGQGKLLGGTIKYGGAAAGFLLINSALIFAYNTINQVPAETEITIDGEWSFEFQGITNQAGEKITGEADIKQEKGRRDFKIVGSVTNGDTPQAGSFNSIIGSLHDDQILFVYTDTGNELGLAQGVLTSNAPDSFEIVYNDLDDSNDDVQGRIKFERKAG